MDRVLHIWPPLVELPATALHTFIQLPFLVRTHSTLNRRCSCRICIWIISYFIDDDDATLSTSSTIPRCFRRRRRVFYSRLPWWWFAFKVESRHATPHCTASPSDTKMVLLQHIRWPRDTGVSANVVYMCLPARLCMLHCQQCTAESDC